MYESLMNGYEMGSRYKFTEPRTTARGASGDTQSRGAGNSLEFMEHREYAAGDDIRRIDWGAYGRTDRLQMRLYQEEVNPHVDLILDVSKSMALGGTKKKEATLFLTGFFASVAAISHYSFALHVTESTMRRIGGSNLAPSEWEPFAFETVVSPLESLQQMAGRFRNRGIRIFISDLLFMGEPNVLMGHLSHNAAMTLVVQLLAQDDAEPPEAGNLRLKDTETEERLEIYLDTVARNRYLRNMATHQENYNGACRHAGAAMTTMIAEKFLEKKQLDELLKTEILRIR